MELQRPPREAPSKSSWLTLALACATAGYMVSYAIHHPDFPGYVYSDIVSFYFRDPLIREMRIPYVELAFEYPPLAGLITYLSALAGGGHLAAYYAAFSIILFAFYITLVLIKSFKLF